MTTGISGTELLEQPLSGSGAKTVTSHNAESARTFARQVEPLSHRLNVSSPLAFDALEGPGRDGVVLCAIILRVAAFNVPDPPARTIVIFLSGQFLNQVFRVSLNRPTLRYVTS